MTRRLGSLILALLILSGLFLGFWQLRPPKAREGPDFVRLEKHIKAMASGPHPAGSQGIALTQGYLKEQLTEMGYRFQEESYPLDDDALMLRNTAIVQWLRSGMAESEVIARVGLNSTRALRHLQHYL